MHTTHSNPHAAVVLAGCGFLDGAEIQEAVSLLVHLDAAGADTRCFAPDDDFPAVDHRTGETNGQRNALTEAARITRGACEPLDTLDPNAFDVLFFPGGFGAAKNLSDFAEKGAACAVRPDVAHAIDAFKHAGKPVGMCCIAPILAAKQMRGCTITLGAASDASAAAEALGAVHRETAVTETVVDQSNKLVTTPAYMHKAAPHEVYKGIGEMVTKTLAML